MTIPSDAAPPRPKVYFPDPPSDPGAMAAKHRLADVLRSLNELCTTVDASASGTAALEDAAALLAKAKSRLEALPSLDRSAWTSETTLAEVGPFVGTGNPIAAPLHLELDGNLTRGWAVYGHAYEGGTNDMHGGAVIAAFDDLLGCAQMVGPVTGRTGSLTVRFRAASPIGRRIDYQARLVRVEGRKAFCSGEAYCGDVLLAEAEAIFVAPAGRSGGA
jgi:hypothetical protein